MKKDNKKMLDNIIALIETINRELPLQQTKLLWTVINNEGITKTDLSELLDMPQATVSRNITTLASKLREDRRGNVIKSGYGLITVRPDDFNGRRHACYLSQAGKNLAKKLQEIVER